MGRADLDWLLEHVDNPANEHRWGDARGIADRAGISRRAISQKLVALEQRGRVESKRMGPPPSQRSDPPPRHWRRNLDGEVA